ncbi:11693_t:CDS:2 [Gigaspora margarita]|uniref:11693_t:CDS:1 n=1 Tax=Gigaspora margarita TaxID=4874 RepID=A0ABN7VAY2_GIGMA|nr:11693_t:CDS:2 [Gigaspora margarita]
MYTTCFSAPSIYLKVEKINVDSISEFINKLETVALDEVQENLLKIELDPFVNDKEFYEKTGLLYHCGFLFYRRPGTRKTSLINTISSHLFCDLYYINLNNIRNDNEISAVFSSVLSNQIIVLEDVDAQSNVLYKRCSDDFQGVSSFKKFNETEISLSNFLRCLDGHVISEVMMTMVVYRNNVELIPEKVLELVNKYKDMNPEDAAMEMIESENIEITSEETKSEEPKTDEVKSEATKANKETQVKKAEDEAMKKEETLKYENVENKLSPINMTKSSGNHSDVSDDSGNTTDIEVDNIHNDLN